MRFPMLFEWYIMSFFSNRQQVRDTVRIACTMQNSFLHVESFIIAKASQQMLDDIFEATSRYIVQSSSAIFFFCLRWSNQASEPRYFHGQQSELQSAALPLAACMQSSLTIVGECIDQVRFDSPAARLHSVKQFRRRMCPPQSSSASQKAAV